MSKRFRTPIAALVTATLVLALSGCIPFGRVSSPPAQPTPETTTSSPPDTGFAQEPSSAGSETPDNVAFGNAVTYADGVSISVSAPTAFTPTEYAAGATQAAKVAFQLVITNGSDTNLNPAAYSRVSSGGVESSSIFDSENPIGSIGSGPTTAILPGGSITWMEGYSVADPSAIVFQISPSFEYPDAVFTNQK